METRTLKEVIGVIKAEERRRQDELQLRAMELPPEYRGDYQYDQWISVDEPFVHELYRRVLVAGRHEIERELVKSAAQVGEREITPEEYQANLQKEMKLLQQRWEEFARKLKLETCD